jgi:diguanylate cyclase (GGDEF)-like protein
MGVLPRRLPPTAGSLLLRGSPQSQFWDSRATTLMAGPGGLVMLSLAPLVTNSRAMLVAGAGALLLALWAHLTPVGAPAWIRAGYSAFAAPVIVLGTAAAEAGTALDVGSIALVSPLLVVALARSRREIIGQLVWAELVYGTYLASTAPWSAAAVGVLISASVLTLVTTCISWLRGLLEAMVNDLEDRARRDPLTGLLNRRGLEAALVEVGGNDCALLLFDIDHFKRINDTFGHGEGDDTLIWFARLLQDGARPGEAVARIGGEEFVLCTLDAADGPARAEQLCNLVKVSSRRRRAPLTTSVGVACGPGGDLSALLTAADAALYQAKRSGRDRVEVSARQ